MKTIVISLWISLILLSAPLSAAEKKVVLASSEFPPFFSATMPNQGVITEMVVEAYKKVGYKVEIHFFPFARTYEYGKSGRVDGIVALWRTTERDRWFDFSVPLPPNELGFYKRIDEKIQFSSLNDLRKYRIGTVIGYVNPPGFDTAGLNLDPVSSDEVNLKKLEAGHVDLILIDKWVAQYLIRTKYPNLSVALAWMDPPIESKLQYIAFSKNAPDHEQKLLDFNRGFEQLVAEGRARAILQKNGIRNR